VEKRAAVIEQMKAWAARLKRDVLALWLAARDPRVPLLAKIVCGLTAAYALSPIDLIPDFIPVLGYLDDLLIVPAGIWLAIRLVPPDILADLRAEAQERQRPISWIGLAIVVTVWLAICAAVWVCWIAPNS
jgi:uncharacterized membrane protein YkvA (DUF1232 family)